MMQLIIPKLPMRNKQNTLDYYKTLGFAKFGFDFDGYLIMLKDGLEIHFFEFTELNPLENYGQIYIRVEQIENLYQTFLDNDIIIHPNGKLELKPWGQKEFSLLDPDHNLITFGENQTIK